MNKINFAKESFSEMVRVSAIVIDGLLRDKPTCMKIDAHFTQVVSNLRFRLNSWDCFVTCMRWLFYAYAIAKVDFYQYTTTRQDAELLVNGLLFFHSVNPRFYFNSGS